jgi:hypothetical protein
VTKVELFEIIRRDLLVQEKSIRSIARERGIHRRTVRDARRSAIPPPRKTPERDAPVLTAELQAIVKAWIVADGDYPRKQRHTARRIFKRLKNETGYEGAESTVRRYVGVLKRQMGMIREAFVPQTHQPGQEAEVDWYEAAVEFPYWAKRARRGLAAHAHAANNATGIRRELWKQTGQITQPGRVFPARARCRDRQFSQDALLL